MKYIDAERLRAAIKEHTLFYAGQANLLDDTNTLDGYDEVLAIIDSLQQEQPSLPGIEENGIPGKDFIPVGWVDACEKYGKWKIVKVEQPEVGIKKELDEWMKYGPHTDYPWCSVTAAIEITARHFYELGRQEQPEIFDTAAFQKGVQEGRRLEREDVKSTIQSRIDEILGDAQPAPVLRMELQELIKKIEA